MAASLLITTEDGVELALGLGSQPVAIGRAGNNTLHVGDRRTSRRHAIVQRLSTGIYELVDAGSHNGTILNGTALPQGEGVVLKPGDTFLCGGIRVELRAEALTEERPAYEQVDELRGEVGKLIDEQAQLREEVGKAREDKRQAERQRDEEHEEAFRLRAVVAQERQEREQLEERLRAVGAELRNERARAG